MFDIFVLLGCGWKDTYTNIPHGDLEGRDRDARTVYGDWGVQACGLTPSAVSPLGIWTLWAQLNQTTTPTPSWVDIVLQGITRTRSNTEQEVNLAPQYIRSDDHRKDIHSSHPREERSKIMEMVASLETQVMTLAAENTMDAEQEVDKYDGMTVDGDGPFNCTEDREKHAEGRQLPPPHQTLQVQRQTLRWKEPDPNNMQNNTRITR